MAIAKSKLTKQGKIVVRRAGAVSWDDVHNALFPTGPVSPVKTLEEMNEGIRRRMRKQHGPRRGQLRLKGAELIR